MECEDRAYVYNRQVPLNPSNVQLENQMICSLMSFNLSCPLPYLRASVMWSWPQWFPKLKFTGSSLPTYFDKLFNRTRAYKSVTNFSWSVVYTYGYNIFVTAYKASTNTFTMNQSNSNFVCFNSTFIRIDCSWTATSQSTMFTRFNITFGTTLRYNIDTSMLNGFSYSIQNGLSFLNSY